MSLPEAFIETVADKAKIPNPCHCKEAWEPCRDGKGEHHMGGHATAWLHWFVAINSCREKNQIFARGDFPGEEYLGTILDCQRWGAQCSILFEMSFRELLRGIAWWLKKNRDYEASKHLYTYLPTAEKWHLPKRRCTTSCPNCGYPWEKKGSGFWVDGHGYTKCVDHHHIVKVPKGIFYDSLEWCLRQLAFEGFYGRFREDQAHYMKSEELLQIARKNERAEDWEGWTARDIEEAGERWRLEMAAGVIWGECMKTEFMCDGPYIARTIRAWIKRTILLAREHLVDEFIFCHTECAGNIKPCPRRFKTCAREDKDFQCGVTSLSPLGTRPYWQELCPDCGLPEDLCDPRQHPKKEEPEDDPCPEDNDDND